MSLRAETITFSHRRDRIVLREVTLDVPPGTVTAIFGPNGSGKTTLLRCMNGTLRPQSGRVMLNGRPLDAMSRPEIARRIAVVPQDTPVDVPFSAAEMVLLGRYAHWDVWAHTAPEDRTIVEWSLARLNALDLADRPFSCLSGGERQRIVLARALAQQTPFVLLDEPNTHLDIPHQLELYRLVRELAGEGKAILMACHDILVAPMFVDNAILMQAGKVYSAGPVAGVLTSENLAAVFGTSVVISWQQNRSVAATFT